MELLYLARSPEASCSIVPEAVPDRSNKERAPRPRLTALSGLRFVAALHIVIHHLADALSRRAVLPAWATNLVVNGYTSTSLFFILSGFVLAYAYTAPEGGFRGTRRAFWVGRFARLYPLSVLGHVLVLPLVAYGVAEGVIRAALVLTATQAWVPWAAFSYNYVAWSVSVLAFFYLAFPFAVGMLSTWSSREVMGGAALMWVAGLIVPALLMANGHSRTSSEFWTAVHHAFPLVRLPEFLFGILLGTLFLRHGREHRHYGGMLTAAGVALLVVVLTRDLPAFFPLLHNGLLAPVHGVLLYGVACGAGSLGSFLSSRPMKVLADASLPLFVLHVPMQLWIRKGFLWLGVGETMPALVLSFALYFVVTIAVSIAAWYWFVEPVAEWVRARLAPAQRPATRELRVRAASNAQAA